MSSSEAVGVIGAGGDLGGQLAVQLAAALPNTHLYDIDPSRRQLDPAIMGVDRETTQSDMLHNPTWHRTIDRFLGNVTTVHWCAPLEGLNSVDFGDEHTVYLHDSVMTNSCRAQRSLFTPKRVDIVHLLVNLDKRALVSLDSDDPDAAYAHLEEIGLAPRLIGTDDHDDIMAISQAPMAILHELLGERLNALEADGLLTQSGAELAHALRHRASQWTPTTMATMLTNPRIAHLLDDIANMVHHKNGNQ